MTTPDRLSPLHEEHVALGASLTSFGGWQMPLRYTSDLAEHRAVREAAGLFDLSHMGEIEVRGPQAAAASRPRPRRQPQRRRAGPGPLHDDLRRGRLGARRPGRVPPGGGDLPRRGQRGQRTPRAARAGPADRALRRSGHGPIEQTALIAVQGPRAEEIVAELVRGQRRTDGQGSEVLRRDACRGGRDRRARRAHRLHGRGRVRVLRPGGAGAGALARVPRRRSSRSGSSRPACRRATRCGSRRACRSTATSSTRPPRPYEAGLGRVVKLDKVNDDGTTLEFVGRAALASRRDSEPARVLVGLEGPGQAARAGGLRRRAPRGSGDGAAGHRHLGRTVADPRLPDRHGLRDPRGSPRRAPSSPSTCAVVRSPWWSSRYRSTVVPDTCPHRLCQPRKRRLPADPRGPP